MKDLRIEVKMGAVVLNHAYFLTRTEDAIVLGIDSRTKHPEVDAIAGGAGGGDSLDFYLAPKEGCEVENLTEVSIFGLDGDWRIDLPGSFRYEVRVFLWRVNREKDEPDLWVNPDEGEEEP